MVEWIGFKYRIMLIGGLLLSLSAAHIIMGFDGASSDIMYFGCFELCVAVVYCLFLGVRIHLQDTITEICRLKYLRILTRTYVFQRRDESTIEVQIDEWLLRSSKLGKLAEGKKYKITYDRLTRIAVGIERPSSR